MGVALGALHLTLNFSPINPSRARFISYVPVAPTVLDPLHVSHIDFKLSELERKFRLDYSSL